MSKQNFRAVICGIKERYHLGRMLNFLSVDFTYMLIAKLRSKFEGKISVV